MDRWIKTTPSEFGHKKGDVIEEDFYSPTVRALLIAKGAIAPASTPPLSELPGWTKRGEKLSGLGIDTAGQLIEADVETLDKIKELFNHKTRNTVRKWQTEIRLLIQPAAQPKRGG